ncbi:hypothetical protein BHE90_016940 [Fusarium euwallaceae]|uniref:Uncharacterized protein n=1 Tax=Fusarium euwallaceae TaxID=1147111 RepID=A0A430KYZ2_9HYPO|nr:hypothetical protein BHE90_016940 [Fusarium euwallaceae]
MVSSLLGGSPLKVDAIPNDNGFIPDGKGSQITNHSHARLVAIREWNYNSSGSLLDAGPVSMDTGFSIVNVPDQQTVDPLIQAGNRASTGVSMQTEHPERPRDTGVDLIELFNNASYTAYDDLSAPARAYPNTVDLECYGDVDISPSVPTARL